MFPIIHGVVNFCWFIFKWSLVAGLLGVIIAVPLLYNRVDEEIRFWVEQKIALHYINLKVTVRSAELVEGEGIRVRGISITEPQAHGPQAELLHLEEVFLCCQADLEELLSGQPQVTRVVVRRPTLRATRRPEGTWSSAKLWPPPEFGCRAPEIAIENGSIEILDPRKDRTGTLALGDINLVLVATADAASSGTVYRERTIRGTFSGDYLHRARVEGLVDPDRGTWTIAGTAEGLEISPELFDALPEPVKAKASEIGSLRGRTELGFRVSCDPAAESPYQFDVSGRLDRGQIDHAWFPLPLTDILAEFRLNNDGWAVSNLTAYTGQSTLEIASFRQAGYEEGCPLWLDATIQNLELDHRVRDALPEAIKDHWPKYLPTGQVHAQVKLHHDGRSWQPEVVVQCVDVAFTYYKFPYRLQHAKGKLELKDDVLSVDVTASSGSRPAHIWGQVFHPLTEPSFQMTIQGNGVPFDEKLFAALSVVPGKSEEVLRSLDPRGTVNVHMEMRRDAPDRPTEKYLHVGVNNCSVKYDKFSYPLGNVQGIVEWKNDVWTFQNLVGTNDTGRVTCNGRLGPTPRGNELVLDFLAVDVPLEEELRNALGQAQMRRLWDDLKLQGAITRLDARVQYLPGQERPSLTFHATPESEKTSIEPACFPYRLEKLQGDLVYHDGHVEIERFSAEHGDTNVSATVACDFQLDGSWHLELAQLLVDQLRLDRTVNRALPERLKKTVEQLNPRGPMTLTGTVDISRGSHPDAPLVSSWDMETILRQGTVDVGVMLENLNGGVKLKGNYDGRYFHGLGELDIDSVNYKQLQFTQVRGPIWVDEGRVLFGTWVDRPEGERPQIDLAETARQPRSISASLCGGTIFGDGWVILGAKPHYGLQARLSEVDLARCARELVPGRQNLRGKIFATVALEGTGRGLNTLGGEGHVHVRDADVYELPLMISLLKILSIREPNRSGFSESDIDFLIRDNHVYLARADFHGDAISLEGSGQMDFDGKIDLTFRSMLGRKEVQVPVLRDVLGWAGEQIMLIHVGGTIQDPQTWREPLPVLNQAQQQIQAAAGIQEVHPQAGRPAPRNGKLPPWIR